MRQSLSLHGVDRAQLGDDRGLDSDGGLQVHNVGEIVASEHQWAEGRAPIGHAETISPPTGTERPSQPPVPRAWGRPDDKNAYLPAE